MVCYSNCPLIFCSYSNYNTDKHGWVIHINYWVMVGGGWVIIQSWLVTNYGNDSQYMVVIIHNPTITGMQHGAAHPVPWLGPFLMHWEAPRPPCNRGHRAQGAGCSGENKGADSKAGWSGQGLQGPDVSRVSFYKSFGFKARQTSKTGMKTVTVFNNRSQ